MAHASGSHCRPVPAPMSKVRTPQQRQTSSTNRRTLTFHYEKLVEIPGSHPLNP